MRALAPATLFRSSLVLVSLLGVGACGLTTSSHNPFDGSLEQEQEDRLRIQIQNMNFNDVTIYAVSAGQRERLGNVTGKTDRNFRLRWNYANPISFEIDVVGGSGCDTNPLAVEPGARVWVQIPNQVRSSGCRSGRA
ncbi:MAG: hypothetical protein U5R14_13320 [Gemmatimonadota bacterium]|nr:hypothetical protein [Gemmatimonadota bacterium]